MNTAHDSPNPSGTQSDSLAGPPPVSASKQRVQAVSATFRNILLIVFLIFIFAVVRTVMFWRVCTTGMRTATSLEYEGLPTLSTLASLQEHLALYRLSSYEYLFAKEGEKTAKANAAETLATQIRTELKSIRELLPDSAGQNLASNLEDAVDRLDIEFQKVRNMVDSDFPAAMKEMDENIPARTQAVTSAADDLKAYGYDFAGRQANATFGAFEWIKDYSAIFGFANTLVAFGAVVFVLLASRRSNAELSETLARLDGRTLEVQQANDALQTEVAEHQRAEETLRDSEERFSGAFEHAPNGVALVSIDGPMIKVNRAFCDLFGYSEAELLSRSFQDITQPEDIVRAAENVRRLVAGECRSFKIEEHYVHARGHLITALSSFSLVRDAQNQPLYLIAQMEDISDRKRSEAELESAHRRLMDLSRQAGMAEVATSVLHNVGNVLNSVNISATVVIDGLRNSQRSNLGKVAEMLEENSANIGDFITNDAKGKRLPVFIRQLNDTLIQEQESASQELESLRKHIDHIKDIVSKQQSYAKISGVMEVVEVADLVEDSLHMNAASLDRHQIELVRDYQKVPPINVDKHKVLQILVNLIRNAKHACDNDGEAGKKMTIRVADGDGRIKISVIDNGIGIPAENLTRIFNHGFTTRKDGHGFGLHSGAIAAKEMGGSLTVDSKGFGQGATFTLEIPCKAPVND
jgi:PAS domain S-box-containing protein